MMTAHSKILLLVLVLVSGLALVASKPTKRYRYDAEFLDSEIQRIRSGRAGHELEPEWNVTKAEENNGTDTVTPSEVEEASPEDDYSDNSDYYTTSEETDITCAPGKGWHIRGQRCVPLQCPGGPAERDFNTGECLYTQQPKGRFNRSFRKWNDLNHVYRSSPMSTSFVRSMVLMRKG